jgi:hypothetical protein
MVPNGTYGPWLYTLLPLEVLARLDFSVSFSPTCRRLANDVALAMSQLYDQLVIHSERTIFICFPRSLPQQFTGRYICTVVSQGLSY